MNLIYQIFGYPLGWIMWALYGVIRSYGIALLIFTIITKAGMFPLSLKQQRSTAKMMTIQPQLTDIQSRYKNDKQKLNEEMMKLYQREGYNPMAGCLPMLVQFPVLFGLIEVIYRPLYHILRLPREIIDQAEQIFLASPDLSGSRMMGGFGNQLSIIRSVKNDPTEYAALGQDIIMRIQNLNLSFLGMDLTQTPSTSMFAQIFSDFNPILFTPILSGVSALAMSLQSLRSGTMPQGNNTAKSMMLIMPVFSVVIAFQVPAGVGLYWFYSNLTMMVQTLIMNRIYNPREIAEKAKREHEERQERERQERIEAKKKQKESAKKGEKGMDDEPKALTQKEINRMKLAEARKRDAEKYGEEYVEVTDDDLR